MIIIVVIVTIILLILGLVVFLIVRNHKTTEKYKDLQKNPDYKGRKVIDIKPNFKLNAYCINLKHKRHYMKFIREEWKDFLNIKRFNALDSCTKSHCKLFQDIWSRKEKERFPLVIMEDDVYRRNNFTKYWNKLLDIKNCDYVPFDAFYLKFRPSQSGVPSGFVSLLKHNMTGFAVFYKRFFDRFDSVSDIKKICIKLIDMNFTHNPKFINFTPREQVVRQIVSKKSESNNQVTKDYNIIYDEAEKKLSTLPF